MTQNKKVLAIMQARMSSTRLPGKVLKQLGDATMLEYELKRLGQAKTIDKIIVATSTNPEDDAIEKLCKTLDVDCFRGSLDDVLLRYAECAKAYPEYGIIVRVTGDCPLIDPVVVDRTVNFFLEGDYDYVNNIPSDAETFPDGMDTEVFLRSALNEAAEKAQLQSEHEHVTPYIRNAPQFRRGELKSEANYGGYRLTVDNPEDFEVIHFLTEHCSLNASYLDYIALLDAHPEIRALNTHIARNEGLAKSLKNDSLVTQKP